MLNLKRNREKWQKMNRTIKILVLMLSMAFFGNSAQALVLDFETLHPQTYMPLNGSNYGGLTWDADIYAVTQDLYHGWWNNSTDFTSGDVAVFNGCGTMEVGIQGSVYDFNGAFFSYWSNNDQYFKYSSSTITMTGYASGVKVGSVSYALTNEFIYYSAEFLDIDTLVLTSSGSSAWWLMDNMTINAPRTDSAAPVPEPSTALLLGTGLWALVAARRKAIPNKKSA